MSLEVVEIGGFATIQDLGREGWGRFGVPTSGPMDVFACRAANALVGNRPDCAAIEIGLGDVTFQAKQDCIVAATGAGYRVSVYIWEFPLWDSFFVRAGWKIRLSKMDDGMWAYLAVNGGIQTRPVLGSRATYLRGSLGGFDGRQLQAGDLLEAGHLPKIEYELAGRTLSKDLRPTYCDNPTLHIIRGPQAMYFSKESIHTFLSSEYTVNLTSDRMGYRLDGPALALREKTELISEGMSFGVIQVTASGQPIVMMADCPTTGGYPKIGTVASADLPMLAQCVPNRSRIRFQEVTVAEAQKKFRDLIKGLEQIAYED
jgi:antagonist of KipI